MTTTHNYPKGKNFRAMVIDLARIYKACGATPADNMLIHDVLIAVHEGALATDTEKFSVQLDPHSLTFHNLEGDILLQMWSKEPQWHDEIPRLLNGMGDSSLRTFDYLMTAFPEDSLLYPVVDSLIRLKNRSMHIDRYENGYLLRFTRNEQVIAVALMIP